MKRFFAACFLLATFFHAADAEIIQPNIPLRPNRTVFLYAKDAEAAVREIPDPVFSSNLETLGLEQAELAGFEEKEDMVHDWGCLAYIAENARFDIYLPEKCNGQMVVICPGGGYGGLNCYSEGLYVAEWMVNRGIAAVVAKHRLPNGHWEIPLTDMHIIMHYLRDHSAELGVEQIGVIGFSAGGHMAASIATLYQDAAARPDFQILVYPVVSFFSEKEGDAGTGRNLIECSDEVQRVELLRKYSLIDKVNSDTPPAYMIMWCDDPLVSPINATNFFSALLRHGVASEMHVLNLGKHGFGFTSSADTFDHLRDARPIFSASLERWLKGLDKKKLFLRNLEGGSGSFGCGEGDCDVAGCTCCRNDDVN